MALKSISRRQLIAGAAGLSVLATGSISSVSAQYPLAGKTIRIVYPFAAGNTGDAVARILGNQLRRLLEATVLVENRAGAAGRLGTQSVVKAEPDGTTLLLAPLPVIAIYPHSYDKLGYDPYNDFQPVSQVALFDVAFVAGPKPGLRSLKELIDWARANPSLASYGSSGAGGIAHLFAVMFAQSAKLDMNHVSYRGSAPAMNDVLGGQIPFASVASGDCIELHKSGAARMLGISGAQRLAAVPDVPTFIEAGVPIEGSAWYGLYAPAKTPAGIVDRLSQAVRNAMSTPAARDRLLSLAVTPTGTTPQELARIQLAASDLWGPVVAASGFKPEQ
jgi:tripartite-type tricarboxylate transporter receptor subunit TctC